MAYINGKEVLFSAQVNPVNVEITQVQGDSETAVMSQKATTEALATKLASKGGGTLKNRAYVVDGNGSDTTLAYSANANAYELVQRTSSGNINVPAPASDTHAVNKQYVEEDSEIANRVTTLEGALIDFKETESEAYEVRVPEKSSGLAFVQSFANRTSRNRITDTSASGGANVEVTKIDEGVYSIKGTGTLPTINFSTPFQDIIEGQQYYFGYHIEGTLTPTDEEAPSEDYTLVGPNGPEYGETIGSGYQAEYHIEPTMQFECNMDFTITMWLSVDPMTYEEYESPKNVVVTAIESRSANILDMEAFATVKRTHAQSGFTLEYDATEKCLILNGTNGATAYDCFMTHFNNKPSATLPDYNNPFTVALDTSKKYNLAIDLISGTATGTIAVKMRPSAKSVNIKADGTSAVYTVTDDKLNYLNIYLGANCTANNLKFRIALIEQDGNATEPKQYVDYFKHIYTIPQGIQEMSEYKHFLATPYEVDSILSFVDKTITYWTDPWGATETKDVSAYLTNGISGLPVPVEAGGILRFVNSDNAPVTSGITFLMSKV